MTSVYSPERRTAVVFAGTGAHGAYHAGVLRALEEAGVKLDRVEFLASFPNLYAYRGVEYPVVDLFFTARVQSRHAAPLEDVTEVVWAPPEALRDADLAFPSHARAIREFSSRRQSPPR